MAALTPALYMLLMLCGFMGKAAEQFEQLMVKSVISLNSLFILSYRVSNDDVIQNYFMEELYMSNAASLVSANRIRTADIVFFSCILSAVVYMIWLSPYGIASADEAFYLTVPYRLTQGDVFFVDEWHPSQLSGFLLYPLMKLYLLFEPEKTGMVLTFRYFYVAAAALTSIYIYFRGRRISVPGAIFASMLILLYSPFDIKALSYNSMVVFLLSAACITAATIGKHGVIDMFFIGLCMAGAVLCVPYLAIPVVLYIVIALGAALWRVSNRRNVAPDFLLSTRGILAFTCGVFTLFMLFCIFVLSRTTLGELIEFFPWILRDPDHNNLGWLWYIKNYILCVITSSKYSLIIVSLYTILSSVMLLDKNRMNHRILYILAALALSIWYSIPFVPQFRASDAMLPINFLGFYAYYLSEKRDNRLFFCVFVVGILCSFCQHHASNQRYQAICNAAAICSMASAFFISKMAKELWQNRKSTHPAVSTITMLLIFTSLLMQIGAQIYIKATYVYGEPDIVYLDTVVPHGVQKGLISTSKKVEYYEAVLADTQEIRDADTGYVLYVSQETWLPLADNKLSASNSGWTFYESPKQNVPLLLDYLRLHPEKYASYIYVTAEIPYSYKPAYDGKLIINALNSDGREVYKTNTGYIIK